MMFQVIEAQKAEIAINQSCQIFGVSQSGFYAWQGRTPSQRQLDDMVLLAHIRSQFSLSHETYGSLRMMIELKENGLSVGHNRVARLMRDNDLKPLQKRRFKKTTDSDHAGPVAPNVLDQDFEATAYDQKWGVDISYIWTAEGWLYLAIVVDLFSRRIIGWEVSDRMKQDLAIKALKRAIAIRQPTEGVIHHSDRGSLQSYLAVTDHAILDLQTFNILL